jgi:uncharacterized damage-inducible protein DinB
MGRETAGAALALALAALDEAFDKKAWHGPNLRAATRRVDARAAAWRPAPGRHNVWEIAVHAAYWKYAVRRRLTGEKRGSFALKGSNWFTRPEPGTKDLERAWQADLALLAAEHDRLRAAVAALPPRSLGESHTVGRLVRGAALHDVYHAGQIQLLKRLASGALR